MRIRTLACLAVLTVVGCKENVNVIVGPPPSGTTFTPQTPLAPVGVSSVQTNVLSVNLKVDATLKVTGTAVPTRQDANFNPAVTWMSSDPTRASVSSDGTIKGVFPGTAQVRARSVADTSKYATIEVTVVAK